MSDTTETTQSTANPVDDLEGYLKAKAPRAMDATTEEPAAQPGEPSDATPAPAVSAATPEEPKKDSWRGMLLDDVDDEFLKGKPAEELLKSQKAAVAAMQKAQREANEARREVERLRQEAEARTAPPPPAQLPNPDNDPEIDEINRLLFEDTPAALKLIDKRTEDRARAIVREEYQQARQVQTTEEWQRSSVNASAIAAQRAVELYGWDDAVLADRMKSVLPIIQDRVPQWGPGIWTNPDVYLGALRHLYGEPPQAQAEVTTTEQAAPPTPSIPNPPGSGRPAPVSAPPANRAASALSREQQDARRAMAQAITQKTGIAFDADEFARGNKRKASNG